MELQKYRIWKISIFYPSKNPPHQTMQWINISDYNLIVFSHCS